MSLRGSRGADMKTDRRNATQTGSPVYDIAVGCEAISIPVSRRARLLGASALAGGALRGLAIAAGMVTALGATPALAQCFSGTPGVIDGAPCAATPAVDPNATAVGFQATAQGINAT